MKDSRDAHFEVSLREFDLFSTKILFFISMIIESEIKYCERSMFLSFLQDRIYIDLVNPNRSSLTISRSY